MEIQLRQAYDWYTIFTYGYVDFDNQPINIESIERPNSYKKTPMIQIDTLRYINDFRPHTAILGAF